MLDAQLSGYEKSSPVRTCNAAADQLQLDVWGEVLDALHLAREASVGAQDSAWQLQVALLTYLQGHWQDSTTGFGRCAVRADTSPTPRS
jgi:GH15 family glucan-1,4-alpha-glucosidase